MHRFPSSTVIRRIRLVSLLLLVKCALAPAAALLLIYALVVGDRNFVIAALGMIGVVVVAVIWQWILSGRTQCPLCMTPVLASKRCAKHRGARAFLGSYRLRVALAVFFTNSFRCPYCNEPSTLAVRERGAPR